MTETYRMPEDGLTPEYWSGHGFEDSCDWINWKLARGERVNVSTLRRELDEAERFAKRLLEAYRDMPRPAAIRRFREGDVFNGAQFSPGTIVRFEDERLTRARSFGRWESPRYARRTNLGVIYPVSQREENRRTIIWTWEDHFLANEKYFRPLFSSHTSMITMGAVEHERISYGAAIGAVGSREERLDRINWLDVVAYGEGVAVRAPGIQRATDLAPQTS